MIRNFNGKFPGAKGLLLDEVLIEVLHKEFEVPTGSPIVVYR